jgi:TolB-like protein
MRGIIEELRYRNVFRVAVAYVVAGWLIAQVADLAADAFNAPDWVMQMLIVVLLIGLPVALFLAWAYELTPEGVRKAKDLPADMPKDPRSGRILNRLTIIALVVAVAWLGWDKLHGPDPELPADAAASVADKSIAVLPFDDFSPDKDQAWFADGLTEEILNSLARTADLHVASRTSSFAYRDTTENLSDIARALGVAHILEGSVRRAGNQLRVTAQLIRAADDKHLWSETFDGDSENPISIQEEIAISIANALETAMDPDELERMVAAGTRSVEAWEIYLRGLALRSEAFARVDARALFEVADVFDRAVAIDPAFVDAHLALADLWYSQLDLTTTAYSDEGPPYAERRARFVSALEAAIRHARSETDRTRAQYRKAAFDVRINDQVRWLERLVELDPSDFNAWTNLLEIYQVSGKFDKAAAAGHMAWSLPRSADDSRASLIYNMRRVDLDAAVMMVDTLLAEEMADPNFYYQAQRALLDAGQVERAAQMIDKYALRSVDQAGLVMMQLRQACAEGRVEDANALYQSAPLSANTRWLFLKTLGRDDEARETLRQYDTPEHLFILAEFLDYRTFDPRHYPLLWKTLQAQGIDRPPARPQTFQCRQ